MLKKPVLNVAIGLAVLGLSSAALAGGYYNNGNYYAAAPIPVATPGPYQYADAGFVLGVQGGYADTHWDNIDSNIDSDGFTARGYLGYAFNKYFQIESGYTYLPKAKGGDDGQEINNYAIDLLGKLSVPITPSFSVYAKAGGSYLHANLSQPINGDDGSRYHIGPAYGVGAQYEIAPNWALAVDWERFSGQGSLTSSDYLPQQDAVFLGLSYKFATHYS